MSNMTTANDLMHLGAVVPPGMRPPSQGYGMTTATPLYQQPNYQSRMLPPTVTGAQSNAGEGILSNLGGLSGVGSILQGIGSLGSIYSSLKAIGLARDQLDFSKEAFNTNVKNQTQTYNTALEDRVRARHVTEGRPEATDNYLSKHRL